MGAGFVVNLLAHYRSLEIVHSERQRGLREKRCDHDPMGLDVIEVVEEESADGEIAEIIETGRRSSLPAELDSKLVVVGVISERNVGEEAVRFVLEIAKHRKVLDAVLNGLDVSVKHCAVRSNPKPVRGPMDIDPVLGRELFISDRHAHALAEDFGSPAGQGVQSSVAQGCEDMLDRKFINARDVRDLDCGERFDVNLWVARLEASEHLA